MLAHGKVLADEFLGPEVLRVAVDHRAAGLDPVDIAVMDLAEKVAGDATALGEEDIVPLRDLGLSDDESSTSSLPRACAASSARHSTLSEWRPTQRMRRSTRRYARHSR